MPSPPQKPATSVHVPISCARACAQCSVPNSAFSVFLFAPGSTSARAHARACKKGTTPLRLQKELRGKKHHPAHPSNELETPLAAQGCLRARRAKADKTQVVLLLDRCLKKRKACYRYERDLSITGPPVGDCCVCGNKEKRRLPFCLGEKEACHVVCKLCA